MIGFKLTQAQAAEIAGKHFNESTTFNPKQDISGEWFIFEGEVNGHVTVEEFFWVKDLTQSEYVPPINEVL